jgi:hypothetical protein
MGFGVVVSYFTSKLNVTHYNSFHGGNDLYQYDIMNFSVGTTFSYHFATRKKIDPYFKVGIGHSHFESYETYQFEWQNSGPHSRKQTVFPPVYAALTIGLRGYLTERFGLYSEIGFDNWALVQAGLVYKLK